MTRKTDKCKIERPERLSDQVADLFMEQIKEGLFKVGDSIPSEASLSKQFGVSRTVIREALARLKYEGVLESKRKTGAQIGSLANLLTFRLDVGAEVSSQELTALYELRAALEGDAAALAAERRSEKQISVLKNHFENIAQAIRTDKDYSKSDAAFHQTIADASGNIYLRDFTNFLSDQLSFLIARATERVKRQSNSLTQIQNEHEDILNAIVSGDPLQAREAAREHLRNAFRRQKIDLSKGLLAPGFLKQHS